MEGLLILAMIAVGIAWLFSGRKRDREESLGELCGDVGHRHVTCVDIAPPATLPNLPGFDGALKDYCLGDDSSADGGHDIYDLVDRCNRDIQDANWLIDTLLFYERNSAFDNSSSDETFGHGLCINPATGLAMMSGCELGFDVGGSSYGFSDEALFTSTDPFGSDIEMGLVGFHGSFD